MKYLKGLNQILRVVLLSNKINFREGFFNEFEFVQLVQSYLE